MIPRQIAAAFPSGVRTRGDAYFSSGHVLIVGASDEHIAAHVSGTAQYLVEITASQGMITAMCTCPFAADNGICKHIWATLRTAESERKLDPLVRSAGRNAGLVALGAEDEGDDVDVDFYGDREDDDLARLQDEWMPPPRATHGEPGNARHARTGRTPRPPEWKSLLDAAGRQMSLPNGREQSSPAWPADRRIVYIVDLTATWNTQALTIDLATERLKSDGTWDPPVAFRGNTAAWQAIPDPRDRQIAQMLIGATPQPYGLHGRSGPFALSGPAFDTTLRLICDTGRCRVRVQPGERPVDPVGFDDGPPWTLRIRIARETLDDLIVEGVLERPNDEMLMREPAVLHPAGVLLARGKFARFDHGGAFALVSLFRDRQRLRVRESELPSLLETLHALPRRPALQLPAGTRVVERREQPQSGIVIHPDPSPWRKTHRRVEPFFLYGALRLSGAEPEPSIFDRGSLTVHHRDVAHESAARERLGTLGIKEEWHYASHGRCLTITEKKLTAMILALVADGWRVEADGALYRAPAESRAAVRSGIDWFELSAGVRYGDIDVSITDLIAARRTGATTITLSDGSLGVIPVELLARLGPLAAGGTVVAGALRFTRSQTALLDALLAVLPEPDVDAAFERARAELRAFDRVAPADPPASFRGTLREYQREGLGWLHFLRDFGLGGCLADDMGLGKTVQVLALLESRRIASETGGEPHRPSLVVVPRSLVFNWMREAERFAPSLRMLDFTGTTRRLEDAQSADVIVTTYGTLRRDAARLATIELDYAILDEAQAIKTASSASAKAARVLRAHHRLAMTGTPIENRLEELWSLFEFLNPGMLGAATTFAALVRLARSEDGAPAADRAVLSRALKPVILRRTKGQVATELPARVEQTLHVELEGAQRKFYDDLLESYRESVLERVDRLGIGKARMHILEALLRLRQAACHPALADPRKTSAPSAKLDALIPALEEVIAEGHKALVFSQFTTFLDHVRSRLDEAGVTYEYLDGKTRDRQARVDRFQTDEKCPLFLISLKAGGHGLNLTAAEYVFILDPWWNPAVEAQAVDRAHRIGQTKQVIATRIVARDTIEEKILTLQASKRALAEAILGQDQGVLAEIGRAELEMLLG